MKYKKIASSILMVGLLTGCGMIEETLVNKPQESEESKDSIELRHQLHSLLLK